MSLNIEKLQEYCRLCQENLGTINIVDNDEFNGKIFQCSNIKINDERMEVFPKSVCNRCHLNVEEMFNFIEQIKLIDKKLRDHFIHIEKSQIIVDAEVSVPNSDKAEQCQIDDPKKYLKNGINENHSNNCDQKNDSSIVCNKANINRSLTDSVVDCVRLTSLEKSSDVEHKQDLDNWQKHSSDEENSNSESLDDTMDDKELKKARCKNLYPCTYDNCSKVCTSSYTFRTHLMKHEGKTPFLCVTCGKGFRTKNSLNCHEKIHAKVKAYECTECNIRFSVSSNLRAHQRKHHEGIRYYCSQCPLVYISKYSLERHELVHTGVKEYKCGMCKSAFYTNKELTKHQRYHQGLRLYKCEQCFKTFFEKHHLTIHMRGHTGERPYVCKITGCGKSFTESQKLTRHLKARHPLI